MKAMIINQLTRILMLKILRIIKKVTYMEDIPVYHQIDRLDLNQPATET